MHLNINTYYFQYTCIYIFDGSGKFAVTLFMAGAVFGDVLQGVTFAMDRYNLANRYFFVFVFECIFIYSINIHKHTHT